MSQPTPTPRQLLAQGLAHFNAGRMKDAGEVFRAVLAAQPDNADAHHLIGLVALRTGDATAAVAAIERAVTSRPAEPVFLSNLAVALKAVGRRDDAVATLREAIRVAPGYVQAHVNLGNTLREDGLLAEAAQAYREALALVPDTPAILNNLGNVHRELGDLETAVLQYRRAIELAPSYAEALSNLASAELARGAFDVAIGLLERAVSIEPGNGTALATLGRALLQSGRPADAEAAYRRAVAAAPQLAEAHAGLADTLVQRGEAEGAVQSFSAALAIRPGFSAARSGLVFMRNYLGGDDALSISREARAFGESLARPAAPRVHRNDPRPGRRLAIGLVSGDFRSHAVATFLSGVLPEIDREAFRLHAYATSPHRDVVTERFRQTMEGWCDASGLDDKSLAERIETDRIDILTDLSGHTMFNRLPVFALKPAPVQMSWLGYSGTTGVKEIDYVLGDNMVTPSREEDQLVEAPWRMPDSYLCWTPPAADVSVGPLPSLADGMVTFGSFNNVSKLSDGTVALWSRVLHAVPRSRLMLKAGPLGDPDAADAMRARFARHGVPAERLMLVGRIADAGGHLGAYGKVDIGLDPFPYNGTTTTAEALWMGVPVLTLRGDRFIAHVGESMLTSAGLEAWIAADADAYVEKAAAFAADLPALAALRSNLRRQLVTSPLCDGPRFARNLEAAWRGMWRHWCASRAAAP